MTGGSQGLGKAIAIEIARLGADVSIVARTKDVLIKAAAEIKVRTSFSYEIYNFSMSERILVKK